MGNSHTALSRFLTLGLLSIVFISQLVCVFGDLAPNEDDDDDVKPPTDLKKVDETITTLEPPKAASNLGFIHAFIASFSVIIVSEIGDKTFFIAAIMSMVSNRHAGGQVLSMLLNLLSIILEISTIDCLRGRDNSSRSNDDSISSLRNGVHPVYTAEHNSVGVSAAVRCLWPEDAPRGLEHDSGWRC